MTSSVESTGIDAVKKLTVTHKASGNVINDFLEFSKILSKESLQKVGTQLHTYINALNLGNRSDLSLIESVNLSTIIEKFISSITKSELDSLEIGNLGMVSNYLKAIISISTDKWNGVLNINKGTRERLGGLSTALGSKNSAFDSLPLVVSKNTSNPFDELKTLNIETKENPFNSVPILSAVKKKQNDEVEGTGWFNSAENYISSFGMKKERVPLKPAILSELGGFEPKALEALNQEDIRDILDSGEDLIQEIQSKFKALQAYRKNKSLDYTSILDDLDEEEKKIHSQKPGEGVFEVTYLGQVKNFQNKEHALSAIRDMRDYFSSDEESSSAILIAVLGDIVGAPGDFGITHEFRGFLWDLLKNIPEAALGGIIEGHGKIEDYIGESNLVYGLYGADIIALLAGVAYTLSYIDTTVKKARTGSNEAQMEEFKKNARRMQKLKEKYGTGKAKIINRGTTRESRMLKDIEGFNPTVTEGRIDIHEMENHIYRSAWEKMSHSTVLTTLPGEKFSNKYQAGFNGKDRIKGVYIGITPRLTALINRDLSQRGILRNLTPVHLKKGIIPLKSNLKGFMTFGWRFKAKTDFNNEWSTNMRKNAEMIGKIEKLLGQMKGVSKDNADKTIKELLNITDRSVLDHNKEINRYLKGRFKSLNIDISKKNIKEILKSKELDAGEEKIIEERYKTFKSFNENHSEISGKLEAKISNELEIQRAIVTKRGDFRDNALKIFKKYGYNKSFKEIEQEAKSRANNKFERSGAGKVKSLVNNLLREMVKNGSIDGDKKNVLSKKVSEIIDSSKLTVTKKHLTAILNEVLQGKEYDMDNDIIKQSEVDKLADINEFLDDRIVELKNGDTIKWENIKVIKATKIESKTIFGKVLSVISVPENWKKLKGQFAKGTTPDDAATIIADDIDEGGEEASKWKKLFKKINIFGIFGGEEIKQKTLKNKILNEISKFDDIDELQQYMRDNIVDDVGGTNVLKPELTTIEDDIQKAYENKVSELKLSDTPGDKIRGLIAENNPTPKNKALLLDELTEKYTNLDFNYIDEHFAEIEKAFTGTDAYFGVNNPEWHKITSILDTISFEDGKDRTHKVFVRSHLEDKGTNGLYKGQKHLLEKLTLELDILPKIVADVQLKASSVELEKYLADNIYDDSGLVKSEYAMIGDSINNTIDDQRIDLVHKENAAKVRGENIIDETLKTVDSLDEEILTENNTKNQAIESEKIAEVDSTIKSNSSKGEKITVTQNNVVNSEGGGDKEKKEKINYAAEKAQYEVVLKDVKVELLLKYSGDDLEDKLIDLDEQYKHINNRIGLDKLRGYVEIRDRYKTVFDLDQVRKIGTLRPLIKKIGYKNFPENINQYSDLDKEINSTTKKGVLNAIKSAIESGKVNK